MYDPFYNTGGAQYPPMFQPTNPGGFAGGPMWMQMPPGYSPMPAPGPFGPPDGGADDFQPPGAILRLRRQRPSVRLPVGEEAVVLHLAEKFAETGAFRFRDVQPFRERARTGGRDFVGEKAENVFRVG